MKNNAVKVSVIIPVYNTEKYVREAIESITKQTLKEIEVIVVDDGSTDKSLQVTYAMAMEDSRVYVYAQRNQGASVARNLGIMQAQGKYIYFMDSDDLLEEDALEVCYNKCEAGQLDFVFFNAKTFIDGDLKYVPSLSYHHTSNLEGKTFCGTEAFKTQIKNKEFTPSPCLSFIRRRFMEEYNLQFYPGIIHEDQLFTVNLYLRAQMVACINRTFFHRRMRENSIMTRKYSLKNIEGYLTVAQEILKLKEQEVDPDNKATIDLYLSQMLDAAIWQAHALSLKPRVRLALISLFRYKKYVSARTIGAILFKSIVRR